MEDDEEDAEEEEEETLFTNHFHGDTDMQVEGRATRPSRRR